MPTSEWYNGQDVLKLCLQDQVQLYAYQPEHSVALLEATLALGSQLFDRTAELDSQRLWRLRWQRVHAFSLQQIHTVQPEAADFHERFRMVDCRPRNLGDVEFFDTTFATFNVLRSVSKNSDHMLQPTLYAPTARMVTIVAARMLMWLSIVCNLLVVLRNNASINRLMASLE